MNLLERQIDQIERATEKIDDARSHFRKASICAKFLKSDIGAIAEKAKMAALAIAGIGTSAGIALSPGEELLKVASPVTFLVSCEGKLIFLQY